jgi:integrase
VVGIQIGACWLLRLPIAMARSLRSHPRFRGWISHRLAPRAARPSGSRWSRRPTSGGRLLKRAKLSPYRVYDCRHTYASLLLNAVAPITYVAQQLGHSSPATTLRHYAKWVKGRGRRWVDLLDRRAGAAAKMEPESGTSENGEPASM